MFQSDDIFEEVLSRRLSGLYALTLFLAAGDADRAETLLLSIVRQALSAHLAGEDAERALDQARFAVIPRSVRPPATTDEGTHDPEWIRRGVAALDPDLLRAAAAGIPVAARAAIWLVTIERRTYADAASVLGVDSRSLAALLAWRGPLLHLAMTNSASVPTHAARRRGGAPRS